MDLKARIEALEKSLPGRIDRGRIYDALKEIEQSTSPPAPGETPDQWEKRFIKKHGSRAQFIAQTSNHKEG